MSGNLPSNVVLPASVAGTAKDSAAQLAQKARLSKVAHQFEAIFTRQMLAAAHKGSFGEAPSDAMNTFNSMQDSKFADISASHDSLGIAKMLEARLGARTAAQKGS